MSPASCRSAARAVALFALVSVLSAAVFGCSPDPAQEPLASSQPAEQVLRTLRLAGIDSAQVGERDREVAVRATVPVIDTAADVRVAASAAYAAARHAYPSARVVYVQLADPQGNPLLEVVRTGDDEPQYRYPVTAGDFEQLPLSEPPNGRYLDAKNAASGLAEGAARASSPAAVALRREVAAVRKGVPGRPSLEPGQDASIAYAQRILDLLGDRNDDASAALKARLEQTQPGDPSAALVLRNRLAAVEYATTSDDDSLADQVRSVAEEVATSDIPQTGPLADAVLVAANDPAALVGARSVERFEREPSSDASASVNGDLLPARVAAAVRAQGGSIAGLLGEGGEELERWLAYRRSDGRLFWLADPVGAAALTDATLDGFAWTIRRADVVDAKDVGTVTQSVALP